MGLHARTALQLALLLSLGSMRAMAATSAEVSCAAADAACAATGLPRDHAMLQVGKKQTSRGEPVVPDAKHHPEHHNPYVEKVDLEHKQVGCFPRAKGDPKEKPENFRDPGCVGVGHNETRCHSGLPFFRLQMQQGQSYLDCVTFCVSKGLDIFGVMVQDWGSECRCGASTANTAAWKGKRPPTVLMLPEAPLPEGDEKCAMLVWQYSGNFEDGGLPWSLNELSGDDLIYVDSVALGKAVRELEGDEPASPENKTKNKTALLQTKGYCEDYDSRSATPKWVCSSLTCSSSLCNQGTFGPDCCPRTCGLCSGTYVGCTGGMHCGPGKPWPKDAYGVAYINYYFDGLNAQQRDVFVRAAQAWEQNTCLRFRASSANPKLRVGIYDVNSCTASRVGYPGASGEVRINMGFCNGPNDKGLLIHEIGHALGMNHEHFRPDTTANKNGHGPHLQVYWYNFYGNWANQYKTDPSTYVGSTQVGHAGYDFYSVMHYPQGGGSANGQPVYKTLPNGQYDSVVGQLTTISNADLAQLRDMYQCSGSSPSPTPTPTPTPTSCADSTSYRDPEFGSGCSEWRGYACQASSGYSGQSYTQELRCACPSACNTCSSLSSCSAPAPAPTPTPAPQPTGCSDSASYRDPEYQSSCAAWSGYQCSPSTGWRQANYQQDLRCACPQACGTCSSLSTCPGNSPSPQPAPTPQPSGCQDSASYRDPEYSVGCSSWTGYACQPSSAWRGVNYASELSRNCPEACGSC